ncbi:FAD-dependent oxidoreductase, partial [Bacillus sp. RHFS18]|nr:FAD-dependent oxidoreductase [Bacillus sp. RHFS18]
MKSYIIIGGGILGASAAYHLAKAGAEVTVIDRKHPGQA